MGVPADMPADSADPTESPAADGTAAGDGGAGAGSVPGSSEPASSDEPTLPVAAVARRLGVAPATLRTWDRRYGVGPSAHTDGKHRRYAPGDVARLEVMQRALLSGASTAEAARYARDCEVTIDAARRDPNPGAGSGAEPGAGAAVADDRERTSRLARKLSAAAFALDARAVHRILDETLVTEGPLVGFDEVLTPVLGAMRGGWEGARAGVEAEYVLAECALLAFARATPAVERPSNHHPVLLVSAQQVRRNVALYALAAGLSARSVDTLVLGSAVPPETLVTIARRSVPSAMVVWDQGSSGVGRDLVTRLARSKQRSRVFTWGPGWDVAELPVTVEHVGTAQEVTDRVTYVLTGSVGEPLGAGSPASADGR